MATSTEASGQPSASPEKQSLLGAHASAKQSLNRKFRLTDTIIQVLVTFSGVISIFTTIIILVILLQETALFLSSNEFVIITHPVEDPETAALELVVDIGPTDSSFELSTQITQDLFDGQYVTVDEEIMQVISRSRRVVNVRRGMNGTEPDSHDSGTPVIEMQNVQIALPRCVNAETGQALTTDACAEPYELGIEDTRIPLLPGFGTEFVVGDVIRIGIEQMLVTEVGANFLEVERGANGTEIVAHTAVRRDEVTLEDEPTVILKSVQPTVSEFLTGTEWVPPDRFGIWPLFTTTLVITAIAMLVAVPVGLGAAIYLSEYADRRVRNILKPILEVLAGIPTVVYGFFALLFMSPLLRSLFGQTVQFQNIASAGIVVGILLVPYISSFSEDALQAVPRSLREASYGMGATKLETTIRVILPAAASGISASFILAISRAIGETMIVALAAGSIPRMPPGLFEGAETMTGHIARISGGDLRYGSVEYTSIFAIGAFLFIVTLALNIVSNFIQSRFREEY